MIVMSETSARAASCNFVHPWTAMSSAMSCASNRTGPAALWGVVDIREQQNSDGCRTCQQQNAHTRQQPATRLLRCSGVSTRPIFHAEFGEYLVSLRTKKEWTQSDAGRYARKENPRITRQVILHLEKGKTRNPKPDVLRVLAKIYDVSYDEIAEKLAEKYSRDLLGQRQRVQRKGNKGAQTPDNLNQTQEEDSDAGLVASSRLLAEHAINQVMEAARAFRKLSDEATSWSTRLEKFASDTLHDDSRVQNPVAGAAPPAHRRTVRTHDRQLDSKRRRGGR